MNYDRDAIYAALSAWDDEDQPTGEQIDAIIAAYQAQQAQPITARTLLTEAQGLLTEDGSDNAEYDRAIVELVTRLLPGVNHDDHDQVMALIKSAATQPERTWTFTINATFAADTQQDAWDMWVEWLTNPLNLEDGTQVTEDEDEYDDGTPSVHLQGTDDVKAQHVAELQRILDAYDYTEGQDRESYTDDQDRDSYTVTECYGCTDPTAHDD